MPRLSRRLARSLRLVLACLAVLGPAAPVSRPVEPSAVTAVVERVLPNPPRAAPALAWTPAAFTAPLKGPRAALAPDVSADGPPRPLYLINNALLC